MKKKLLAIAFLLYFFPTIAFASWWNPSTWNNKPKSQAPVVPIETISRSLVTPKPPTVEELQSRIAQLEEQLRDALSKIATTSASVKSEAKSETKSEKPAPQTQSTGASDSLIMKKVTNAIVLVETATSSGSGVIIDSDGHILTTAHNVWTKDSTNAVVGVADTVSVSFYDGSKKTAKVVGFDEASDIAIVQLANKNSGAFVNLGSNSSVSNSEKVYVVGFPVSRADSAFGYGFVPGTVSRKSSNGIDATVDLKPIDNGGAMLNSKGTFIGIPRVASCKILEEMTNCLKYVVTANSISSRLPKIIAGMILYKDKKYHTDAEALVRGQLEGSALTIKQSGAIDYAIAVASGKNSFDYFNSKLGDDEEGKITKVYLNKLKLAAESIYNAVDFLKSESAKLNVFFVNESASIDNLGDYQRAVIAKLQSINQQKLKEYQDKVSLWSRKKNEYDSYISKPSGSTHDYLMAEGVYIESATSYISKERQRFFDSLSGETTNIF